MNVRGLLKLWLPVIAVVYTIDTTLDFLNDQSVAVARSATTAAVARADTALKAKGLAEATVRQIAAEADTAIRNARRAEARAIRANEDYTRLRRQFAEIEPSTSPDSIITAADSALAAADSTISGLRTSLGEQIEATAKLQVALETEQAAHTQTANALTELRTASTSLVKSTRPSLIGRLLPQAGFGVAAGLDLTGRPNVVVGITLSFR